MNSPYLGRDLPGEVRWTLFRGAATVEDAVVAATMGAPVGTGVRA